MIPQSFDLLKDLKHASVLVRLWWLQMRNFVSDVSAFMSRLEMRAVKELINRQPIVICVRSLSEIVVYFGQLWLEKVL